jgi:urease accessory protein
MNKPLYRLAGVALALAPATAWAHPDHAGAGGLLAGLEHPLTGVDHLVAMLLVGLWAGLLAPKSPRALALPATFLAAMLAGFVTSAFVGGGFAEPIIVLSLVALGAAAALRLRAPMALATGVAALFGFAHGLAHGFETPGGAFPALFAVGFLASTGALHAFGLWLARVLPAPAMRVLGAAGAGLGLVLAGTA